MCANKAQCHLSAVFNRRGAQYAAIAAGMAEGAAGGSMAPWPCVSSPLHAPSYGAALWGPEDTQLPGDEQGACSFYGTLGAHWGQAEGPEDTLSLTPKPCGSWGPEDTQCGPRCEEGVCKLAAHGAARAVQLLPRAQGGCQGHCNPRPCVWGDGQGSQGPGAAPCASPRAHSGYHLGRGAMVAQRAGLIMWVMGT